MMTEKIKSSIKKLSGGKVQLRIEAGPEVVEERFQDVLRDFQKAAALPGFREGKAPMEMVEKKFSSQAQEEVLKSLIPELYHRTVAEQKLSPVSLPSISEIEIARGKSLVFTAEFDGAPEFSLKNYKGLKIKKSAIDVQDSDVEKGMASLLDAKAELSPLLEIRPVKKGDFVITDIEIWQDGRFVPGRKAMPLQVEENEVDDFFEKIVGAQRDEVREITAEFSEEEKKTGLVGRKPLYKIWIREICEKKLPELNDEFAAKFGKTTVDELKIAIRKDIASYKQNESYEKMKHELFEKLLKLVQFELPQALVDKQKERLMGQMKQRSASMGIPEDQFEKNKAEIETDAAEKAREQVKLYFILQKIADTEGIDVDEEAFERKLQALSEESGRPVDEARQVFGDDLTESMREAKTVEFLLANAKLEEETK